MFQPRVILFIYFQLRVIAVQDTLWVRGTNYSCAGCIKAARDTLWLRRAHYGRKERITAERSALWLIKTHPVLSDQIPCFATYS